MPRFVRPDRSNREESVQEIWRRLGLESTTSKRVDGALFNFDHNISKGLTLPAIGSTYHLSLALAPIALVARHESRPGNLDALRLAFACFYWQAELMLHYRRVHHIDDRAGEDGLIQLLNWQGLSLACGLTWFTDWIAPYISNLFLSGGVEENATEFKLDLPANFFVRTLQTILITRQWPRLSEAQVAQGGPYAPLFVCAGDEQSFSAALTDYCDYRVAQCFGYAGIDAEKRRRPSHIESLLDMADWGRVFPAELFTLQHAYERATGRPLALNSEHPLLHTRLVTAPFPALEPLYEDEVTKKLQSFGESTFGSDWQPRREIPSKG